MLSWSQHIRSPVKGRGREENWMVGDVNVQYRLQGSVDSSQGAPVQVLPQELPCCVMMTWPLQSPLCKSANAGCTCQGMSLRCGGFPCQGPSEGTPARGPLPMRVLETGQCLSLGHPHCILPHLLPSCAPHACIHILNEHVGSNKFCHVFLIYSPTPRRRLQDICKRHHIAFS